MVFDPARMSGRNGAIRNLTIHVLRPGQTFDLATRQVGAE
jgi:hypothetical protein